MIILMFLTACMTLIVTESKSSSFWIIVYCSLFWIEVGFLVHLLTTG